MYTRRENGNSCDGKLFYAVILSEQECNFGPIGLDQQLVHSIHYRDVAALVSDYPRVDSIKLLRKNLFPYHQVVRKAVELFTTVPARFGQIARDAGQVSIALRKNYRSIRKELARLDGKIEMGLKITLEVDDIFNYFLSIDSQLQERRNRLMKKKLSQKELIDFGTYFHERMGKVRNHMTHQILDALPSGDVKIEDPHDEQVVVNVILLIKKEDQGQLEGAVEGIAKSMGDEYNLKLEGPFPPFNFVEHLELHLTGS